MRPWRGYLLGQFFQPFGNGLEGRFRTPLAGRKPLQNIAYQTWIRPALAAGHEAIGSGVLALLVHAAKPF